VSTPRPVTEREQPTAANTAAPGVALAMYENDLKKQAKLEAAEKAKNATKVVTNF